MKLPNLASPILRDAAGWASRIPSREPALRPMGFTLGKVACACLGCGSTQCESGETCSCNAMRECVCNPGRY
jgi:hypothetical protein